MIEICFGILGLAAVSIFTEESGIGGGLFFLSIAAIIVLVV